VKSGSSEVRVIANLVLGANGATTLQGSSRGLSSIEDRKRFHELRNNATAIVIGGQTYRNEPYSQTPRPLFVASQKITSEMRAKNPQAHFYQVKPSEIVDEALARYGSPVLVEGGVKFITELISHSTVDQLFITRTTKSGDVESIFTEDLLNNFTKSTSQISGDEVFEIWLRVQ
jgi:riboflavin biosynthesis pyrimidine reductase